MKLRVKRGRKSKRVASRNGAVKSPKLRTQPRHGEIVRVIDNKGRIVLPDARPGQPMAVVVNGDGSLTITPLKPAIKEAFPRGSLIKEAEAMNREWEGVKPIVPAPPKDWE